MATEYRLPYTAQEFEEKLGKLKDADQAYNSNSENAQSGKAVAQAIEYYSFHELSPEMYGHEVSGIATPGAVVNYVDDVTKNLGTTVDILSQYGLPILKITGDNSVLEKENYHEMNYEYGDMSGTCEMKWQGNSSLAYDKKNYTIKFDKKFVAFDNRTFLKGETQITAEEFEEAIVAADVTEGQRLLLNAGIAVKLSDGLYYGIQGTAWTKQKKYVLKANYIEHTHARNIVSARLWAQIVKSRLNSNTDTTEINNLLKVAAAPMAGAVDGFPIIVMMNDKFLGLYTFNIPKDGWMMNMEEDDEDAEVTTKQAILCADFPNGRACKFMDLATCEPNENGEVDFEIEFTSNENTFGTAQIRDSLNNLISSVGNTINNLEDIALINDCLDWDSAIDYYIYVCLLGGIDSMMKNYILATYDGLKWFYSAYDLDSTFGLYWDGTTILFANDTNADINTFARKHNLMKLIKNYKWDAFVKRYKELRESVLSVTNIQNEFGKFIAQIPSALYEADTKRWPMLPGTEISTYNQIVTWYENRCRYIDEQVLGTKFDFPKVLDFIKDEEAYEFQDQLIINDTDWYKKYRIHHYSQFIDNYYSLNEEIITKFKTSTLRSNAGNSYMLGDREDSTKEYSRTSNKFNVHEPLTNPETVKNILICGDRNMDGVLIEEIKNKFTDNNLSNYNILKGFVSKDYKTTDIEETEAGTEESGKVKYSCKDNIIIVNNVDMNTPLTSKLSIEIPFEEDIYTNCTINIAMDCDEETNGAAIANKLGLSKSPWTEIPLTTLWPSTTYGTTTSIKVVDESVMASDLYVNHFRFILPAGYVYSNLRIVVSVTSETEGDKYYLGGYKYDWESFISNSTNNPFWNQTSNSLDFGGYMTKALSASTAGGETLDYVICILGKECYHTNTGLKTQDDLLFYTKRNAKQFIEMVRSAYPECKILLTSFVLPYTADKMNSELKTYLHHLNKIYAELASSYTNIKVANVMSQVDCNKAYFTTTNSIAGNEYITVPNTTLLSENGYKEMANSIWRSFTGLVNM